MVRRKTQAPATDTEYSDEFEEYITEQCDTEYDVTSGQSDYEHEDETVIFRPKPSRSTAVKPFKPVQQTQRKSLRLLQKKQLNKASETDLPGQQMNQGDSIEMGGLNKNVFVDMTTQIVSAVLTALQGNASPMAKSHTDKTPKIHNSRIKSRRSKIRSVTPDTDSSSESSDSESSLSDTGSIATSQIFKSRSRPKSGQNVKLPAFTGNEKWEITGEAGDFVFDQLPSKTLDKYTKLIKELRNRFGVIESSRTYKLQFSRRRQFSGETPEKFASELKRLYDKAYKNRDFKTRQEDLLQRFLLGLQDYKARIHIELNKDPQTIEEAVHEVITYSETMKNPNPDENNKKTVRQVKKNFGQLNGKKTTDDGKPNTIPNSNNTEVTEQKSKTLTIKEDELKSLFDKMFECKQSEIQNKQITKPNPSQIPHPGYNNQNNGPRSPLICFRCGQPGHMARNCTGNPKRNDKMDVKPPPPFNSQPPPPFNSSWAQNRPNYDQRGAYSYNGPPAQDFGTPKVINKEVKFTGGNDSSDVKDDRSLVKKNCSQEEEKSLDVTNEKSLVPEIDEEVEVSSKVKDETPQSNKLDIIGRQVVRCDADTGAARTVISTRIFKQIPQSDRPKLEKSNKLASANGQPLVEKGKAVFNLELGNLSLAKELVVAEIEDEVLLGLDILMKGKMGPADIKLTEGVILLNGVTIPCIQIGQPEPVRKSEILIDVFVDKTENDPTSPPQDYLIEPSSHFIENHPVMMASSLVDLCHDVTNKVRLINPFDREVQINQDTVVGLAEKVEEQPILLFSSENTKDSTNFDSTVCDAYPLPRIQDCLDAVSGANLFSVFDLISGFHQIPVKLEDRPKTAFTTKYGLYEFKTMPFGVCNGPATCQRFMELVLNGLKWQICVIYLDDIIVFGKNFEQHMERLDIILDRISKAGLKLKPEKCDLLQSEVTFLGHVISNKGIQPNPDNVYKILTWRTPKTVTEVKASFRHGKLL
ncbi:Retrovirus-related Pol polyprotein from transposon opus,Retrovirus-related Pol polyprotein from transposon 17.6 [Mytilus coruscus]|uniref:Retrovirus-related Pol polyprotein from transposon opus,Retrovirus-related Pol polyprotein from transposon 17.6 n=1 Tax=Mytilus coruscus TaxID=42192 RepID=A0A6J8DQS1_MYTCO|nr:Retrovirus-related Pol polyprotein from transposon opus,Retrovirus-related Pol polyprotein from transposon 17.6 [Mytilus coruscus]